MTAAPAPAGHVGELTALALTFCPDDQQRRCHALLALRAEILAAATASAEAAVCEARLAWWADELARLASGRANHPAARAVADALDNPGAAAEYLDEWRIEAGNRLRGERPDSAELFAIAAFRRHGVLFSVMELAAGSGELGTARDVGHACGVLEAVTGDHAAIEPSWLSNPPADGADQDEPRRSLAGEGRSRLESARRAARVTKIVGALADVSLKRIADGRASLRASTTRSSPPGDRSPRSCRWTSRRSRAARTCRWPRR